MVVGGLASESCPGGAGDIAETYSLESRNFAAVCDSLAT